MSEPITESTLFARLDPAQQAVVVASARDVSFPAGSVLFREGEDASGCWIIRSGHAALNTEIPGRGLVVVQTIGPGEVLGWSWLVPPHRWQFTATASTDLSAIELDTDRLRAEAESDPAFGYPIALGLFEVLLARLQSTRARLLDLYGSPRERDEEGRA